MKKQHKFDVVLSFASEDEQHVEQLANLIKRGGHSYFYAKHEEAMLWGKNLLRALVSRLQGSGSLLCYVSIATLRPEIMAET